MTSLLRRFAAGLALAVVACTALPAQAQQAVAPGDIAAANGGLVPYKARYQVSYRGISGGEIEQTLRRGPVPGQWLYESRAYPNILGRIAISPDARQRSTMEMTPAGIRPLSLVFDDGSDSSAKDVRIEFDWGSGRVRGESKGKAFDFPVQPGTQDSASVQAAMLYELLAGREPKLFWILNGSKLEDFRYWPEGRQTVVTPYGQFDTVVWASQHTGSKRVNRVWHAPKLGFVPVQAIQFNKGRPDLQLKLVKLEM
ncbi:MAG: DUF3108 domain-containing protein [Gammaproteobacteria bacterium]|nr:DUF3108 domain-containing protein [Gammaproteobacteria bacterium]